MADWSKRGAYLAGVADRSSHRGKRISDLTEALDGIPVIGNTRMLTERDYTRAYLAELRRIEHG